MLPSLSLSLLDYTIHHAHYLTLHENCSLIYINRTVFVTSILCYTMYCNRFVIVKFVLLLFCCSCLHADICNLPIVLQANTSLGVCDSSCGDVISNNAINCNLSFPSKPLLTISLEQTHWVTAVRIHNTDSVGLTSFSLAYTDTDSTDVTPIPLATLYNTSLPSGGIVEVGKGGYLLVKLQKPVQPVSLSVFGYGAVGSSGCISVELLGCLPHDLSYPIHTSNLLQYRFSLPDNLFTNSTGVEYGYWYGSEGVLTDGIEETGSAGCIHTECLYWEPNLPSSISIFFQFYQPTNIKFIELFQTSNISLITIKSPGTVPPYQTKNNTSLHNYTLTFEYPIHTDYIQIEIHYQHTLTLTEIQLHDSNGDDVLKFVVSINEEDMTSPDYITPLVACSITLLSLLFISLFAIITLAIIAYRTHTQLREISYFYGTLTPETFAIYTSIKRTPKYREYVNVARMYSNVANRSDCVDKSTQPLPKRPDTVLRRMSAASSLAIGDYEKIDHILRHHELNKNNNAARYGISPSPAKRGLVKTLSNGLTFFNRTRNNVMPDKQTGADVIVYGSPQNSPDKPEDPYTPYNPTVIRQKIPPGEECNDHIPLTMSVSNNHLYKVNACRHSPTEQPANFQFVEDPSDLSAKQLAGITLSQLNDSISSDSV